jgi:ATP-dependent Lon protease
LDIDLIEEPRFDQTSFDYLVLDEDIKQTVRKLAVNNYNKKKTSIEKQFSADFIKGKGEGQVFLLHGPPGVGKTCTAG